MGNCMHKSPNSDSVDERSNPLIDSSTTTVFDLCTQLYNETNIYRFPTLNEFTKVYKIINQINGLQQDPFDVNEPSRQDAIQPFMKWCKQNGVKHKNIQISDASGAGLCIMTTNRIAANKVMIAVPNEAMMNSNDAFNEFESLVDSAMIVASRLQVPLALKLINERLRRSTSRWRPYIDILPKQMSHPIFFSPYEFGLIRGSPCGTHGMKLVYEVCCQYAHLYRELFSFTSNGVKFGNLSPSNFTFEAFRWSVAIALSRAFTISGKLESRAAVLAPLWDLFNHGEEAVYTRFDTLLDGKPGTLHLCACAMRDLPNNEEVHICYRESCTPIGYFTLWGLVLIPYYTSIEVKMLAGDHNYHAKSNYLQKLQRRSCPVELQIYANPVPLNLQDLRALLIISATSEDLQKGKVSATTWCRAWTHLIKQLKKRLCCYLSQPTELLTGVSVNSPQSFLARNLAVAEKRVITAAISQCTLLLNQTAQDLGCTELLVPLSDLFVDQPQVHHQFVKHQTSKATVDVGGCGGSLAIPVHA